MATLRITESEHFATGSKHTATSWQTALDENFEILIDDIKLDPINLTELTTPLKKIGDPTSYYGDETIIYAQAKLHFGEKNESPWFLLNAYNQKEEQRINNND